MMFPKPKRAMNEVSMAEGKLLFSKKSQTGKPRQEARAKGALKISEHDLTTTCEDYLEARGLCYIRVPDAIYKAVFGFGGSMPSYIKALISSFIKGLPDFTLLHPSGRFLCVELKVGNNEMSQRQKKFAAHVPVVVCRDFDSFKKEIENFLIK
jgi:hypothetical protein